MKILTVAFFDDNYGDMLIRSCFLQLTKVALQNLHITDYTLDVMPLKSPNQNQITSADMIVFAGGGLFGLSYLDFAPFIETILDAADEHHIPVVFSSLGINNMDATKENEKRLTEILRRPCIKAISVREHQKIFEHYAEGHSYPIVPVCDPVVWSAPIYAHDVDQIIAAKRNRSTPVIGVNIVRGGLFKDNGVDWALTKEEEYLYSYAKMLEQQGYDYRFFTNGSTWDVNTLLHFQKKYKIPHEKIIISETSREVIQAIADFDAVIAIRMHASIISYALSIPSINFVWNPKIPDLYQKLGYPDRAVMPDLWSAEKAMLLTQEMLTSSDYRPDPTVLMTLYTFLYDTYRALLAPDCETPIDGYETVCDRLRALTVSPEEDVLDLRVKLQRSANRYYALFMSDDRKKGEIRRMKKDAENLQKSSQKLRQQLDDERSLRMNAEQERDAALAELNRLDQKRSFRVYKKLFDSKNPSSS